jgi:hypothetical protein
MDGIATSSFGHRSTFSLQSSTGLLSRSAPERLVSRQSDRRFVDVYISRDGDAFSRKVQEQSDRLTRIDPKLAEQYHAVINLLNRTNPQAAHNFLDFMDSVLEGVDAAEVESTSAEPFASGGLQVDSSVSVQVSAFVTRVQGIDLALSQSAVEVNVAMRRGAPPQKKVDPLVLDLDGDGVETSGIDHGVFFDLEANGKLAHSSFVQGDDVLLALDRNENGVIDDGGELFGIQHGAANGFEELKKFDDNRDGAVDGQDSVFSRLRALRRQPFGFEVLTLSQLDVRSIFTAYQNQGKELGSGDEIFQQGSFRRGDGGVGSAVDVGLSLRA